MMQKYGLLILQMLFFLCCAANAAENDDQHVKIIFSGAIYGELEPCG